MKRKMRYLIVLAICAIVSDLFAQGDKWRLEAESPETKLTWTGDTADIIAPKGATLWYKEQMSGDVVIEYDAQVVVDSINNHPWNRLSDLNCFWMASDPMTKDVFVNSGKRKGRFPEYYALELYYVGFGGNHNATTRFRRYTADTRGIDDEQYRPGIIKEYTDAPHLLKPNHWYHIKVEASGGHAKYIIDGETLVDWTDPTPLRSGWFGFRTTLSHTKICNFKYKRINSVEMGIVLKWIGGDSLITGHVPSMLGVPFNQGEVVQSQDFTLTDQQGEVVPHDQWTLAYWPDGSVKWQGFALAAGKGNLILSKKDNKGKLFIGNVSDHTQTTVFKAEETKERISIRTSDYHIFLSRKGTSFLDSIVADNRKVAGAGRLLCSYDELCDDDHSSVTRRFKAVSQIDTMEIERKGSMSAVIKITGTHLHSEGMMLPFVLRMYLFEGSPDIKLVHTVVVDSLSSERRISSIGLAMKVPMRERPYNRHVILGGWHESVQPLAARRPAMDGNRWAEELQTDFRRVSEPEYMDSLSRYSTEHLAAWDRFRLSQLSPNSFSIRKSATGATPWVGTKEGLRSDGTMFAGDLSGGIIVSMRDFWQSVPSSMEIRDARSDEAEAIMWMWSPESEPMNLAHYDTIPHTLDAAYEDVQPGMSSAYGIARTTVLYLRPVQSIPSLEDIHLAGQSYQSPRQLICTPEYLHSKRAFGIWSLPTNEPEYKPVEKRLQYIMDFYRESIDRHGWYGFWNYGDVMHQYDPFRREWMYDVGGYAWDNTELASNMMLWYNFLRTGDADIWRMAEAMTRHTTEVDVYHTGPNAMLGSRHNVSHWGCGAKESRISQAAWNRFYYYLTTDDRSGDLMTEVKDAEQKLYTLDPMRLAQPRSLYPCTAPARLRIGPDWLAYAGNWMTEWERTGNTEYRQKIESGMKSIAGLPHGIFTGPKALGFDPATGVITCESDTSVQNTNHLLPIMGGFEILNELSPMMALPEWDEVWLDFCSQYKSKAWNLSKNRFKIPRLQAYAGWRLNSQSLKDSAWKDIFRFKSPYDPIHATNDAATWTLDAIYTLEVAK